MLGFRRLSAAFAVAAVLGVGIAILAPPAAGPFGGIAEATPLEAFADCDDLLGYFREHALEHVGPYGLGGGGIGDVRVLEADGAEQAVAGAAPAPAATDPAAAGGHSTTNVQEAGVDEPDVVKLDDRLLVTVAQGRLQVLDLSGEPRVVSSTDLPGDWGHELLLDGDRVLVLAQGSGGPMVPELRDDGGDGARILPMPDLIAAPAVSTLQLLDLGDPSDPQVVATLALDGTYTSARMVDGVARVVLRGQPTGLAFTSPEGGGLRAEEEATAHNRDVVRASTVENWLPAYTLEAGGGTERGTLLDCALVRHPASFNGFGTLSVLSVDLAGGLEPLGGTGVVADGETVYASADNLYVALNRWDVRPLPVEPGPAVAPDGPVPGGQDTTTAIHQFDISDPRAARYVASGSVPGQLLNQFALSEHDGHLRVATTEGAFGPDSTSESAVRVLRRTGDELVETGMVGGLGRGERIFAVRFLGPVGYVVTFRQVDPLYAVDLADPAAPRLVGELKIPGYSAYLHPLDDTHLLGVGQDASEDGQVLGTQLSLFDISDLTAPERSAQTVLEGMASDVEWDHRAFLHWAPEDLVVLPIAGTMAEPALEGERGGDWFVGAVAYRATAAGFTEIGRLQHGGTDLGAVPDLGRATIRRAAVHDGRLLTVSEQGVLASDLDDLSTSSWVAF